MILNSNALHIPVASNSVHCVITSPPYFGLRSYSTKPIIFGGDENCVHEYGEKVTNKRSAGGERNYGSYDNEVGRGPAATMPESNFCKKCNAWLGSLGMESSPEQFVEHLVMIFREVKRVLRDDGVLWVNLGDSYWGGKGMSGSGGKEFQQKRVESGVSFTNPAAHVGGQGKMRPQDGKHEYLKPKSMCGIPWKFAFALQEDGWTLRLHVTWIKISAMPESIDGVRWERHKVKVGDNHRGNEDFRSHANGDRPQQDHDGKDFKPSVEWVECSGCKKCEKNDGLVLRNGSWRPSRVTEDVFMFSKNENYYCDSHAVREKHKETSIKRGEYGWNGKFNPDSNDARNGSTYSKIKDGRLKASVLLHDAGRNMRNIIEISSEPLRLGHYASFPQKLVKRLILVATSQRGCCAKCGKQWARVVERKNMVIKKSNWGRYCENRTASNGTMLERNKSATIGWKPTCDCNAGTAKPVVLDPFVGTGTTVMVAEKLGRKGIGLDLNLDYLRDFANWRINKKVSAKMAEKAIENLPLFGAKK